MKIKQSTKTEKRDMLHKVDLDFYEIACEKIYKNFETPLKFDAIDSYIQQNISNFYPTIELSIPDIISSFYSHMTQFDQTKNTFKVWMFYT